MALIEDVLAAYKASQARGVVLSKLDEAVKLGPALDALIRHRLKVVAVANGQRVVGVYRRSVMLASGRFAMLDDGVGFSLVPWKAVIEPWLGQKLAVSVHGNQVSWEFGRQLGTVI